MSRAFYKTHLRIFTSTALLVFCTVFSGQAQAAPGDVGDIGLIPSDANIYNVKNYGAVGDGQHDDTAAIQAAINATFPHPIQPGVIYFPNGTYRITSTLTTWDAPDNTWHAFVWFLGQSQTGTIIRLADNVMAGAGNCAASNSNPDCSHNSVIYLSSDGGGNGYDNYVSNLTVDTGNGNAGAVGIRWYGNNCSSIRNVTIKSEDGQGIAGLDLRYDYPGPQFAKNITIQGFQYGVFNGWFETTTTYEHITLRNQTVAGFIDQTGYASIHDLQSTNSVPAVIAQNGGAVTLVGGTLSGGSSGKAAIQDAGNSLYARGLTVSGYGNAVTNNGSAVAPLSGPQGNEYSTGVQSLFTSPSHGLDLPIQETPEFNDTNPNNWYNAASNGAAHNNSNDDANALQAAFDAAASQGKTTVYFPGGVYLISHGITVHGSVQRIIGFGAYLNSANPGIVPFNLGSLAGQLIIEHMSDYHAPYNLSPMSGNKQTLVMKDLMWNWDYVGDGINTGAVYIENVAGGSFSFSNQQVWARQIDPETDDVHVTVNGGNVWLLGLKTEGHNTILVANGGNTEVLGTYNSYQNLNSGENPPTSYICNNCNWSLSTILLDSLNGTGYTAIQETRNGSTKSLTVSQVGDPFPLYTGFTGGASDSTPPSTPTGLSATTVSSTQINLSWTASTDNVGIGGYTIFRNGTQIGSTSNTTYSDTGLSASTAYSYTVQAYDTSSNTSSQSTSASATTSAPPPPPTFMATMATKTVDGDASDWSTIASSPIAQPFPTLPVPAPSASDLSGSYKLAWDATNLYVLVQVTDDQIQTDDPTIYNNDGIEVLVDANHSKSATFTRGIDHQIFISENGTIEDETGAVIGSSNAVVGVKTVSGGYAIEAAIKWSYLGGNAPQNSQSYGFDIAINDRDNETRESELMWVYAASYWNTPSTWGTLTLTGTVTPLVCDINGDGSVNALDVQLIVNQALGLSSCTADINQDHLCNIIDVQRVANNALGGACLTTP